MAGTSRIDELRKKFDENPRRYFAPLANEYRKIGDFDQAIFICQEFLPQQPGHMSGHIVYGQALFESGRHDEARSVFETALALDPENLIALRHLGDIARAHGDAETARAWYRRVLESDPRNDEIAGILASLDTDGPQGPPPAGTPGQPAEAVGTDGSLSIESAISAATGSEEPVAAATAPDPSVTDPLTPAPSESSFDELAKLFTSAAPAEPSAPPPEPAKPSEDSLNLIHEGEDVLTTDTTTPEEARAHLDALVEGRDVAKPSDAGAAAEPTPSSFSLPFLEGLASPPPTAEQTTAQPAPPEPAPSAPPPQIPEPVRAAAPDPSSAFVTETMAELYVKQGHREQALDVYRQLVQRNPDDAALAGRLRDLEAAGARPARSEAEPVAPVPEAVADAGPTIREFLESIALGRRRSENSQPLQPVADAPNEQPPSRAPSSVTDSLGALFANAEQGSSPGAPPPRADDFAAANQDAQPMPLPGRPSKPAASELSLDHVFRHATPAAGSQSHSFSFDQFFSQQAQQDVAASDAAPATEESAGLSDDIQQFNAWLEGLKKT
ncbi:MAG TPA: tetratricopeptide repeat protein [Gemmatimonadaceae bacterium]|nr:tetratricopeptide repeat protein [Gemmatimonadaceae bacterium]